MKGDTRLSLADAELVDKEREQEIEARKHERIDRAVEAARPRLYRMWKRYQKNLGEVL